MQNSSAPDLDLDALNSPDALGALSVPPGSFVLDVGAAHDRLVPLLHDRGCRLWAILPSSASVPGAGSPYDKVISADLESVDLDAVVGRERFDVILLLDTLAHVHEPVELLRRLRLLLRLEGRIVASVPNATHGAVCLSLLRGQVPTSHKGLARGTPARLFDRRTVEHAFRDAELEICERFRVTRTLTEVGVPLDLGVYEPEILRAATAGPDATTYQFVVVATPRNSAGSRPGDGSLAQRLHERLHELEDQIRVLQDHVAELEARHRQDARHIARAEDLACQVEELNGELERRMHELRSREVELRHVQADLSLKEAFLTELRRQAAQPAQEPAPAEPTRPGGLRSFIGARLRRFPRIHATLRWLMS